MDIVDQKNISSEEEVEFIKKVPLHPRERLSRNLKSAILEQVKQNEVEFVKKVTLNPRDKLRRKVELKKSRTSYNSYH